MIFSKFFLEKLRDGVRSNPLDPEEVRRIVGMGAMYIAISGATVDTKYTKLYELIIDNISYSFYKKLQP